MPSAGRRSHLHLGAIGTAALVQCLLLAFLDIRPWLKGTASIMLGTALVMWGLLQTFRPKQA